MTTAKEYADQVKEFIKQRRSLEDSLKLTFREILKEAHRKQRGSRRKSYQLLADIFEEQNNKWKDMCIYLISYPIDKLAFEKLVREFDPKLYYVIILYGFSYLEDDIEFIKAHAPDLLKEKGTKTNGLHRHRSKAKDPNEGS
jgi:hypothetical protein